MGEETKKAVENFALPYHHTNLQLIRAMVLVKKAAARTYQRILPEKKELYKRIEYACDRILSDIKIE